MKNRLRCAFLALLIAVFWVVGSPFAHATPAMTPIHPPAKAMLPLPIAEQLQEQLQSLVAPPPVNPDDADQEPTPTFGTRALGVVIVITEMVREEATRFVSDFAALPAFMDWFHQQMNDPRLAARWAAIGGDMVDAVGVSFLAALVLELLLYPARRALRRRHPNGVAGKIAAVLGLFLLRALPIIVFIAASVTLLNQNETQKLPRFIAMNVVYALALARIVISFLRGVLSPKAESLRFVPVTTAQAIYGFRWLRAFSLIVIIGYFCIEVARAVHVPDSAVAAFINIVGLALVVLGLVVIVQKRGFVAALIRGHLSAAQRDLSWLDSLRLWFARRWHVLASVYLVLGYAIAALGVQNGLILMLRGTIFTLAILAVVLLLLRHLSLWEARGERDRVTPYAIIKFILLRFLVFVAALAGLLAAWGADLTAFVASPVGMHVAGSAFSITVTVFVLGLIYEFFSAVVDRHLAKSGADDHQPMAASARSRTLLPMIRNTLFVVFAGIVGIVALSEAGVNIAPLLAGAGILGVAVGFGAQTLVKDFLTGLFIILENVIAIGDSVKIGDHNGVVEGMSMRTLRIRDMDGALHILPFSEVSKVINQTKGFAYAVIKVNVASDTDVTRAMNAIRAVGEAMQHDPAFKPMILEPVEALGLDSINDTSLTLIARMRTRPGQQWAVKRMFLFRLKQQFDQDGIQLPTSTTILVQK